MEESFDAEDLIAWLLLNGDSLNDDEPIKLENERAENSFKFTDSLDSVNPSIGLPNHGNILGMFIFV